MLYAGQSVGFSKMQQMLMDFSEESHRKCALMYVTRAFMSGLVLSFDTLVEVANEPPKPCFTQEELDYVLRYLVDHQFIKPIKLVDYKGGSLYVCPHRNIGVDYKHRRHLCESCRREFMTNAMPEPNRGLLIFDQDEVRKAYGDAIEWPDEID